MEGRPAATPGSAPDPGNHIDELEAQLAGLSAALAGRVAAAQSETLDHLALLESSVQDLESSACATAARRAELLAAAKRLATELRGLDLLAGHVKSMDDLVKRLEAAAAEVLAGGAAAAAAAGKT